MTKSTPMTASRLSSLICALFFLYMAPAHAATLTPVDTVVLGRLGVLIESRPLVTDGVPRMQIEVKGFGPKSDLWGKLSPGDRIFAVNGRQFSSMAEFTQTIYALPPGASVDLIAYEAVTGNVKLVRAVLISDQQMATVPEVVVQADKQKSSVAKDCATGATTGALGPLVLGLFMAMFDGGVTLTTVSLPAMAAGAAAGCVVNATAGAAGRSVE